MSKRKGFKPLHWIMIIGGTLAAAGLAGGGKKEPKTRPAKPEEVAATLPTQKAPPPPIDEEPTRIIARLKGALSTIGGLLGGLLARENVDATVRELDSKFREMEWKQKDNIESFVGEL